MKRRNELASIETNAIGLNSMVLIEDIDSGEKFGFYLVTPDEMDSEVNKLSISSPLGSILLGEPVGAIINWNAPSRLRRLAVRAIGPCAP